MTKTKKILSVLLSLVMMLGLFSVVASAAVVVNETEVSVDFDIAGIDAENYEEYIDIHTEGLDFEDDYDGQAVFVYDSEYEYFDGNFVEGETYYVDVYLTAKPGYVLGDIDTAVINGLDFEAYVDYWSPYDDLDVYYVTFVFAITVGEGISYETAVEEINIAEIGIYSDIAGVDAEDYYSYIDIYSDGLMFEDNYGDLGVYVYDSNGDSFYGEFVEGETYYFSVYLAPMEGYYLAYDVAGYVNGEEVDTRVDYWNPGGEYGDIQVDFVELEYSVTVTGEPEVEELSFFARILAFFRILFAILFGGYA